jgi:hypothetical protein
MQHYNTAAQQNSQWGGNYLAPPPQYYGGQQQQSYPYNYHHQQPFYGQQQQQPYGVQNRGNYYYPNQTNSGSWAGGRPPVSQHQQQQPHGPGCACGRSSSSSHTPSYYPQQTHHQRSVDVMQQQQQPSTVGGKEETRGMMGPYNHQPWAEGVFPPSFSCGGNGCGGCSQCVNEVGINVPWGIPTRSGDVVSTFVDDKGFKNTCSSMVDGGFCGLDPYSYEESNVNKKHISSQIGESDIIVRTRDIERLPSPGFFNQTKKKDEVIYVKRH